MSDIVRVLTPEVVDKLHEAGAPVGDEQNWVAQQLGAKATRYEASDRDLARLIRILLTEILERPTSPEHQMAAIDRLRDIPALGLKGKAAPAPTDRLLSAETQKLLEEL